MFCVNKYNPNRPQRQQDSSYSYLVCACAFLCQAVHVGLFVSFGVLFSAIIKRFDSKRQDAAWTVSLAGFLVFFSSPVAGRLTEKFGCLSVTMIGALSSTVGLVLASFAKRIVVYYFTYSLFVGFGGCCVRVSSFLVVSKYFQKRRPFATGILTSAAGLGVFAFAPVTQALLDNFGLENTLRFQAGIVFVTGIPALAFDPNVQENEPNDHNGQVKEEDLNVKIKSRLADCSVWTVPTFTVFTLAFMMHRFGGSSVRVHLVKYADEQGLSPDKSSRLLMYYGLVSCIARLTAGRVCNLTRIDPRFVFQVGNFIAGISVVLLPLANSNTPLILCSCFFGVGAGISVTTSNLIFLTCVDAERRASAFGLASFLSSFATLSSSPLVGFLADQLDSYKPSFYMTGGVSLVSAALPFVILCVEVKRNDERKSQEMKPSDNQGQSQHVSSC